MRDDHIFIMAPPRSGTRMLTRALGQSPETYLITEHKRKDVDIPEEENRTPDREYWLKSFGLPNLPLEEVEFDAPSFLRLNEMWTAGAGGRRLVIKNPNNIVRAQEIRRAFPESKFIWLVRNPWSVIQSMMGGRDAGRKNAMFLGARGVLQHTDPVLRAAASWAYAVNMMHRLKTENDIVTTYEALVSDPKSEMLRISKHVGVDIDDAAFSVPQQRAEDFRLARYLLRRSPHRAEILTIVSPISDRLGYPDRPKGYFGDDRILAIRYLLDWLKHPKRVPVYGYPTLGRMRQQLVKWR